MEDIDVCIKFDHNHKEEIKTYFSSLGSKMYVHILHLDLVQVDNVLISLKANKVDLNICKKIQAGNYFYKIGEKKQPPNTWKQTPQKSSPSLW